MIHSPDANPKLHPLPIYAPTRRALVPVRFCPIDGCYVWSGVELVWHAEATYSRNRRPALFYCDESTISSAAFVATTVLSAPFIGLSCSDTDSEEPRYS